MDYAAFVRQLAWPAVTENPPRFHSIASELDAFEKTVTSQYEQMERSQHPAYVRTSVMLKQARTLDERQQYAGALLEYLLARYRFGSIRPADSGAAVGMQLERSRAALRRDRDNSIARFFIDLASAGIAAGDAAGRAAAAAVVGDILPAYSSALKPAASRSRRATTAQTTITLVRWPFT
ncbi:MAG TPA: hypothetical protein VNR64_02820 [Vicinamibacterales bacterium]|nr:hypothetical protein [Vicinamibacterales bacterium]